MTYYSLKYRSFQATRVGFFIHFAASAFAVFAGSFDLWTSLHQQSPNTTDGIAFILILGAILASFTSLVFLIVNIISDLKLLARKEALAERNGRLYILLIAQTLLIISTFYLVLENLVLPWN